MVDYMDKWKVKECLVNVWKNKCMNEIKSLAEESGNDTEMARGLLDIYIQAAANPRTTAMNVV